jgi:OsmC-like protein
MGYASCFLSALQMVSREAKAKLPEDLKVDAAVHLGKPDNGKPFGLAVDLHVSSPSGKEPSNLKELVEKAHEVRFPLMERWCYGSLTILLHPGSYRSARTATLHAARSLSTSRCNVPKQSLFIATMKLVSV